MRLTNDSVAGLLSQYSNDPHLQACFSSVVIHIGNDDDWFGPCRCRIQDQNDLTRCGDFASAFISRIYFKSGDEAGSNTSLCFFDSSKILSKIESSKNLVFKMSWQIWEKEEYEKNHSTGTYSLPFLEHTYLIDSGHSRNSENSSFAFILQAAYGMYYFDMKELSENEFWRHIDFFEKFDRSTAIDGNPLFSWIEKSLLKKNSNSSLKEKMRGKCFIGHKVFFTVFQYERKEAIERCLSLKENLKSENWKSVIDSIPKS